MAPVNNIGNNINPADRLKQQERVQTARTERGRQSSAAKETQSSAASPDSVNISSEAQQLAASGGEISRIQEQLGALREENSGQIAELRGRIEAGDFDRPEITAAVAETISSLPPFRALQDEPQEIPREPVDLAAIELRVRSGQFDSDQVLEQVATNILNDIGAF